MALFQFDNIKISGVTCVIPKNIVKTDSFKDRFGSDEVEKFIQMTGITQTRWTSEKQTASDLATSAAKLLIEKKGLNPSEIKALVFGTHSPDYRRPASAFVIQKQLGLSTEAAVFDISLGCSAAVYGLQVVASMMANSDIDKAILVVGDTASKTTNPMDRASVMLIGEAAVAIYLEKTIEKTKPMISLMRSDGEGYRYLIVPGGGYRNLNANEEAEVCHDGITRNLHNSFMQGTSVFTFTISDVPKAIKDYYSITQTSEEDYDVFAFHQANLLILKQISKKLKIPLEKIPLTLPIYGNTSGASPLVTLCEFYGKSEESKTINVMMVGFGVGISWGVTSFEIDTNDIFAIQEDDYVFEEGYIESVSQL
jgi:3-oxoacyl-[acyl-carrier-protein] synthase-3